MVMPPGPEESAVADQEVPGTAAGNGGAVGDGGRARRAPRSRYRSALRHRDMRLLTGAFLVDQIGSWSYVVVISVYLFDRTHSTQWLAALGICRWGPNLLLASYGGVIADRYDRVRVLIVSSVGNTARRKS